MRQILSEYAILVLAIIASMLTFAFVMQVRTNYKEFSKNFIGCITGSYVEYGEDITLDDIEKGLF